MNGKGSSMLQYLLTVVISVLCLITAALPVTAASGASAAEQSTPATAAACVSKTTAGSQTAHAPDSASTLTLSQKSGTQTHSKSIIYFGDSRVVGMSEAGGGQIYVGKKSMGYYWMRGEGLKLLLKKMRKYPDAHVVFCFGINDMVNVSLYISFFQSFVKQYPYRKIWFASVGPVNDSKLRARGKPLRNSQVQAFNKRLKEALPAYYLDTYSYLMKEGFKTKPDGIHYRPKTYLLLQQEVLRLVS